MKMNKKIIFLGLVMIAVIVAGTAFAINISLIENLNINNNSSDDIVLDSHYYENVSNYSNDSYTINNVEIEEDILTIEVKYGGGCKEHIFSLFGSPGFMKSSPVQTDVMLSHNANNDLCKALITEEVSFNLTPLKEVWQQMYGESGTIIINLQGFNEPISYEF